MVPTRYSVTAAAATIGATRLGGKAHSGVDARRRGRRLHGARPLGDGWRRLPFDVGDAETAADAALREPARRRTAPGAAIASTKAADVEDLAADVRVHAYQLDARATPLERLDRFRRPPPKPVRSRTSSPPARS